MLFLYEEYSTWFSKLPYVEMAINRTVNASTGQTPVMLVHRAEVILPIGLAFSTSGDISS